MYVKVVKSKKKKYLKVKKEESKKMDYYEKLGIGRGASKEEITKGYKQKAKEYHPDRHKVEEKEENERKIENIKLN